MRVLVLEGVGLAIPDQIVQAIEGVTGADAAGLWLPGLFDGASASNKSSRRRALRLCGGGRVEVPAAMHIADVDGLLELPDLLRHIAASHGVVGLVQLPEGLTLVCDPRRLPYVMETEAARESGGGVA